LQGELIRIPVNKEDAFFQGYNKDKIKKQIKQFESELLQLKLNNNKE